MLKAHEIRTMIERNGLRTVRISQESGHGFYWKTFLDIKLDLNGQQTVKLIELKSPDELVMILWIEKKSDTYWKKEVYLLSMEELQHALFKQYEDMLEEHKGVRPRKPFSDMVMVYRKYLEPFKIFET